jgi:hypothetical protein
MQIGLSLSLTAQLRSSSTYAVLGYDPALVFDFKGNYFRKIATASTFAASITHTRASSATMVNASGTLVTVGNNVPRTGHHIYNGSAWVNEGILHESEARTNLVPNSNAFTTTGWGGSNSTVSANSAVSPDGATTASTLTLQSGSYPSRFVTVTTVAATSYTVSVYAKAGTHDTLSLEWRGAGTTPDAVFNLSSGTVTAGVGTIVDCKNGWFRCSMTEVSVDTSELFIIGGGSFPPTGTIFIYGAQVEAGSTPSSYIPTAGATATRAAETLTVPAANLPYDSTNVSIQIDGKMTYADTSTFNVQPYLWQLAGVTYIRTVVSTVGTRSGQPVFAQRQSTSGYDEAAGATNVYSPNTDVPFNIASRHGSTFINGAHEGTLLTANTTPTILPDLSATDLDLGQIFMGTIGQFRMWSDDLGDVGITEAST